MKYIFFLFLFLFLYCDFNFANEIIRDSVGNYYLLKKDGSYKPLPPPKPGHRYVIKNVPKKKKEFKIFKRQENKSRMKTNTGYR